MSQELYKSSLAEGVSSSGLYLQSINNEEHDNDDNHELSTVLIEAHDELPSISPRDTLSYIDDKKQWKECQQFHKLGLDQLNYLLNEMETAILINKPNEIVNFLVDKFFAEKNQIELRKVVERNVLKTK